MGVFLTFASGKPSTGGGGQTFDYYISTTGSDSNPGTLVSPWAITAINSKQATYAGKRLGIIAGTYDVSSLMTVNEGLGGFNVLDYNIYGTQNFFTTRPAGDNTANTSRTFATWKTATGGDSHSSTNSTNPFTNNGSRALQYQVTAGVAFQTGKVGGVSGGGALNVGAWDGVVTQIGSMINGVLD